jgi:hypothetical protein
LPTSTHWHFPHSSVLLLLPPLLLLLHVTTQAPAANSLAVL